MNKVIGYLAAFWFFPPTSLRARAGPCRVSRLSCDFSFGKSITERAKARQKETAATPMDERRRAGRGTMAGFTQQQTGAALFPPPLVLHSRALPSTLSITTSIQPPARQPPHHGVAADDQVQHLSADIDTPPPVDSASDG